MNYHHSHSGNERDAVFLKTPKQAAAYLRLSTWTLARMRARGVGPAYICYSRRYYYEVSALDAFIAQNRRLSRAS